MVRSQVGHFTSTVAKDVFVAAYAEAMTLWPPEYSRLDVETGFGTTRVYRHGVGDGEPIVLLHGHGANASTWYHQIAALGRRHPVYAIDTIDDPGGSVQRRPLAGAEDAAAWLEEVLAGLELDRVHLVGQSYGGWLALNQGVQRSARTATITLLDPAGLENVRPRFLLGMLLLLIAFQAPASWRPRLARILAEPSLVERPEMMRAVTLAAQTFRPHRLPARRFTDEELCRVDVPTQVILGRRSRMLRADRALARALRLVRLCCGEILPGVGHGFPQEVPDLVNARILAFIAETTSSGRGANDGK
jgi:pimeloyl-ACP methyl ester carboxylesterase